MLLAGCLGGAVPAAAAAAPETPLLEAPMGLAWTPAEVARAGRPAVAAVLEQASRQDALDCRRQCALIDAVWLRLQPVLARESRRADGLQPRLHVVRIEGVEAFASPDGSIVIDEGFIERQAPDAPRLAFVLAHEAAHVLLEHERETLTTALALLPRNVRRTVNDMYVELAHNYGLLKAIEISLHQVEFAADEAGLQLAAAAGFDPRDQLAFAIEQARAEEPRRSLASSHPSARARLAQLQALLPLALAIHAQAAVAARPVQPGLPSRRGFSSIGP